MASDILNFLNTKYFMLSNVRKSLVDSPLCRLFTPNKLVDTLAGNLTWDRTTTATYIDRYGAVKTAAIDTPREESDGWLIEGASTNLLTYSEDFSIAAWVKDSTSVTADVGIAPDGTQTADRITDDTTVDVRHRTYRVLNIPSAGKFTFSVFVKPETITQFLMPYSVLNATLPTNAVFYIDTETAVGGENTKIEKIGDWYRCSTTYTATDTSVAVGISLMKNNSSYYTGTGESILLWGAQVEQLTFASSYIPTTTAAATRAADIVSTQVRDNIIGGDFSGVFNINVSDPKAIGYIYIISSQYLLFISASMELQLRHATSNTLLDFGALSADTDHVVTVTSKDGLLSGYVDGVLVGSIQTTPDTDVNPNAINYLFSNASAFPSYVNCSLFSLYDFALNADEVKLLSGVK